MLRTARCRRVEACCNCTFRSCSRLDNRNVSVQNRLSGVELCTHSNECDNVLVLCYALRDNDVSGTILLAQVTCAAHLFKLVEQHFQSTSVVLRPERVLERQGEGDGRHLDALSLLLRQWSLLRERAYAVLVRVGNRKVESVQAVVQVVQRLTQREGVVIG